MWSVIKNKTWAVRLITYRNLILLGLTILFYFIAFKLFRYDLNQNEWILGDWLVNYQDGGFKRRGLSGSFFFKLQDFTGISLIYLVYSTQLFLYAIFFISFYKLLSKKRISPEFFILIFSPVTLLFFFNDISALGRKEIIIFALFSINSLWYINKNHTNFKLILTSFLLFFFTFWHELILFYAPYFIILHLLHFRSEENHLKSKINVVLIYFIPVFLSFFLIYCFGLEINKGKSIEILHQRGITMNGGIFTWNINSIEYIKNNVKSYALYSLPFIYGCLLFLYYISKHYRFKILFLIISAIAFSIPLFILAIDWGRWIAIHFILILILLGSTLKSENEKHEIIRNNPRNKRIKDYIIIIIFFVLNLSFGMPHFNNGIRLSRTYILFNKVNKKLHKTLPLFKLPQKY